MVSVCVCVSILQLCVYRSMIWYYMNGLLEPTPPPRQNGSCHHRGLSPPALLYSHLLPSRIPESRSSVCLYILVILSMLYKLNHTVANLSILVFLTQRNAFEIHKGCWVYQQLIFLLLRSGIPLCGSVTLSVSVHLLIDIWVAFSLLLSQTSLLLLQINMGF